MNLSATLIRFAKGREAAYLRHGQLTGGRARAVSKIKRVADFFRHKSEREQLCAVRQVADEIRLLLPGETSRYVKLRTQMLSLLDQATLYAHSQSGRAADAGASPRPMQAEGAQLHLIYR